MLRDKTWHRRPRGAGWRRAIFDACNTKLEMGASRTREECGPQVGDIEIVHGARQARKFWLVVNC